MIGICLNVLRMCNLLVWVFHVELAIDRKLTKRILQRSPRCHSEHPEQRPKARLQALSRRQRCFVVRFRRSRALARVHMRSAPAASASRARSTRPFSAPRSGAPLPIACRTRDSLPLSPGEVRVSSYRSDDRRSLRWVSIDSNDPRMRVSSRRVARRPSARRSPMAGFLPASAHPGVFLERDPVPDDA